MKKIFTIILLAVFGMLNMANAQQYPYYYQYLLNKYSLSPAYAGLYGITEGYLGYRQSRLNVDYTPKTLMFNLNAPIGKKVGLGLNIMNDEADIFSNLYVLASYTYHLKVAEDHNIDFTVSGGLNQKKIDLSDIDDPYWVNGYLGNGQYYGQAFPGITSIKKTALELGGGLMYRWKKLNVGLFVPSFYETNTDVYEFVKHYIAYGSYDIKLNENWNLEPSAVVRITEHSPLNFDISAFARYKEKLWFGPTFKKNMIGALSVGGEILKNVVFLYTYDFAIPFSDYKGVLGDDWGGHEITLGYRFGKRTGIDQPTSDELLKQELDKKARTGQVDSLQKLADQLNDKLKALADSLAQLKKQPQTLGSDPAIQGIQDEIKKLNQKLIKLTGTDEELVKIAKVVYYVTASARLTEYSKNKLDEVVEIMRKYPTFNLTIEGHTDWVGSDEYNQRLSDARAASVVDYLISKGISRDRLSSKGYGESRPIDTNETKEGRQNNRRTEIKAY